MMRHGRGVYVDGAAEDQKYEGEWCDDMMQGRGTFSYASGAKYEVRCRPSWVLQRCSILCRLTLSAGIVRMLAGRVSRQQVPWVRHLLLP